MNTIITSILALIGITQPPTTIVELLWDVILLIVSLLVIKYATLAIFGLMKTMIKL